MKNTQILICLKSLKEEFSKTESTSLAAVETPKYLTCPSEEWIYYVFYSCLLDYGMRSKIYHENLIKTYDINPKIFNPQYVSKNFSNRKEELLAILKEYVHPRYPNLATDKWIKLSNKLSQYEDIRYILSNITNFKELENFIKTLGCFGQKTGGLLMRLLLDSKVCNIEDEMTSIPLDRHDIEISYLNRIIDTPRPSAKELENLSHLWIDAGKSLNLTPSEVDKYLWEIGNRFCNKKRCVECPLSNTCKKER